MKTALTSFVAPHWRLLFFLTLQDLSSMASSMLIQWLYCSWILPSVLHVLSSLSEYLFSCSLYCFTDLSLLIFHRLLLAGSLSSSSSCAVISSVKMIALWSVFTLICFISVQQYNHWQDQLQSGHWMDYCSQIVLRSLIDGLNISEVF